MVITVANYLANRLQRRPFPAAGIGGPYSKTLDSSNNDFSFHQGPSQFNAIDNTFASPPAASTSHLSGYPRSYGNATEDFHGKYLLYVLENQAIDLEALPPLRPVTERAVSAQHGVVKIDNIPFTVSAQEIAQFINRFAPIPMLKKHHDGYPIHIIMEKPTGKTMDCFIEFPTQAAAAECVRRFEDMADLGRYTKIGTRNVHLDLSDQTELLQAVFPRARLVKWDPLTGKPTILSQGHDPSWSTGFRGYFTIEEIYGVTRFAEFPARSPFILKCHQRVYECMISTLYKFPGQQQQPTLSQPVMPSSNLLYASSASFPERSNDVTKSAAPLPHLLPDLQRTNHEVGLSPALLFDVLFAAINVPSFSLLQKVALCEAAGSYGRGVSLNPFSATWPFQTLEPDHHVPGHVIKFWLELFDTGFDLLQLEGRQTTFEEYIVFSRNKVGFPIAEWTSAGIELPFEDAIRVETAAMMYYVTRGRGAWAAERQIDVTRWQPETITDLMEMIVLDKHGEQEMVERWDTDLKAPSSRTSAFDRSQLNESASQQRAEELGPIGDPSPTDERDGMKSKFNAATARVFVPNTVNVVGADTGTISSRGVNVTGHWARPFASCIEFGQPQTRSSTRPVVLTQQLSINAGVAGTGTQAATIFKDPFALDSRGVVTDRQASADTAISPLEDPMASSASSFGDKSSITGRKPTNVMFTGVSRPSATRPFSGAPVYQSTINTTIGTSRQLSLSSTATDPLNIHPPGTVDDYAAPSFSSGSLARENPSSDMYDPFTSTPARRTATFPALSATSVRRNKTAHLGPIGDGSGPADLRASSIPIAAGNGVGRGGYSYGVSIDSGLGKDEHQQFKCPLLPTKSLQVKARDLCVTLAETDCGRNPLSDNVKVG